MSGRREITNKGYRTKSWIKDRIANIVGGRYQRLKTKSIEVIVADVIASSPSTTFTNSSGKVEVYYDYETVVNTIVSECIKEGRVRADTAAQRGYPVKNPGPLKVVSRFEDNR